MTEPRETASEVTDEAKAALQAVVESGQAQWYLSGGLEQIEFTAEGFCRWYAAEVAQVRAKVADEIDKATPPVSIRCSPQEILIAQGMTRARRIARGEQP